jgi:hypothetical protein
METATAIEMATVTAMTPMLMPSTLPLNVQQVVQKIPHHKSVRCSSLTGQNGGSINQGMNRLPYNLANQRSHIGQMATIVTILIKVISLLGKRNELMREVFWWLVAGREHLMISPPPKKPKMRAHHLPALNSSYLAGKKRFLLSKLNAITHLTITSKWSISMMEIFLSLDKYPALCKLKLLGAS